MWDYAAKNEPDAIPDSDKTSMFTQYKGIFGVSDTKNLARMGDADVNIIYGHAAGKLLFTQPGQAYWALVYKDEYSSPPKTWRPDEEEREAVADRFKDIQMTDKLTFEELWKNKSRGGLVNIEEGILDKWHSGRIVLVGDSAHKVRCSHIPAPHIFCFLHTVH
jgi:FAD dependent monooxygenase